MTGLYLHIPFCKQACSYCDFYFVTRTGRKSEFVKALRQEIIGSRERFVVDDKISTLYFGGGTPSLLSLKEVEEIMETVRKIYDVSALTEVTFEMNPDDVNEDYLKGLSRLGINRVSMGVQTFNPDRLAFMNRAHNRQEALHCLELLHNSPIDSFNADLIYGNPGQSIADLAEDVNTLLRFSPPHISAYALTIEPRTRLGTLNKKGKLKTAGEDMVARHIDYVVDALAAQGIERYEVSNYARQGHEARHNSAYWNHINYLGFGPAAHSFLWNHDKKGARRWKNTANLKAYLENVNKTEGTSVEELSLTSLAEERLMMGLRTRQGVSLSQLLNDYSYRFSIRQSRYLEKMEEEGYVEQGYNLSLTGKGIKIADFIIAKIV